MKTTPAGVYFISFYEKFMDHAYLDQGKKWTIGYGHLITGQDWYLKEKVLTKQEALDLLAKDIARFEKCVNSNVIVPMSDYQFDAFVSLTFNIGCGEFVGSTLRRRFNSNLPCADEFLIFNKYPDQEYSKKHGKSPTSIGLIRRRVQERRMFLGQEVDFS